MTRHYTVEEATERLAIVEPLLRDAVRLKHEYDSALQQEQVAGQPNGDDSANVGNAHGSADIEQLRSSILERVNFINALGIQVKDLDTGLIDFPTVRDGEEVLLCWRMGEPAIGFWHTEEDGYPGRKPI